MAISHTQDENNEYVRITACPACGEEDFDAFSRHLEAHSPEDFGLSPLPDDPRRGF